MTRQIKFRVWDNVDYMSTPFTLQDLQSKKIEFTSDCPVMQFTGLKDRNGKEIWEGDVVRMVGGTCDVLPCGIYQSHVIEIGELLVVKSLDSGFTLSRIHIAKEVIPNLVGHVDNYTFWNHQKSLEVIGNLYETPHLLPNNLNKEI